MVVHNWRSYKDAKKFVHSLNLKSKNEWAEYTKSKNKPKDIPTAARTVYKKDGAWKGWGDWLGTGTIATYNMQYRSFSESRKFARNLGLKSKTEWSAYSKSGKLPHNIPSNPNLEYKKEWKDWGDWLGSGTIAPQIIAGNYLPFKEAQKEYQKITKIAKNARIPKC